MINLIPYNSTSVAASYHAPPRADSERFQSILTNDYKLFTTIRVEMGADIDGACGQLALENQSLAIKPRGLMDDTATVDSESKDGNGTASACAQDIEDIGKPKKPIATIKRRTTPTPTTAASATTDLTSSTSPSAACATPVAAAPSSSSCCTDASSSCDCASSPASSSSSSLPPLDDDSTIGDVLNRGGLKTYAEMRAAENNTDSASVTRASDAPTPFLSDRETAMLNKQRQTTKATWQATDRTQQTAIAAIILIAAIVATIIKAMQ